MAEHSFIYSFTQQIILNTSYRSSARLSAEGTTLNTTHRSLRPVEFMLAHLPSV